MPMDSYNKIFFVRHGKLSLPYKDHSVIPFDTLASLGRNDLNPPIDNTATEAYAKKFIMLTGERTYSKIFCSPSKRCQETAQIILNLLSTEGENKVPVETISKLEEVFFDLTELAKIFGYSDAEGIQGVNSLVFEGMISGKHCEFFQDAYERVRDFFEMIKQEKTTGNYIVVTHDFIMRVIEIFIRSEGSALPPVVSMDTFQKTNRNGYVSGFSIDKDLKTFRLL